MVTLTDFAQLIFRGRYIPFYITWVDSVTFTMQIGEGELKTRLENTILSNSNIILMKRNGLWQFTGILNMLI